MVYDKASEFCTVHGSLRWPQGQYQHFTCTSSIAACNSQLLPTNQICELLSYPKKTKNPNPSPIGNRFGFFLFGGRGWIAQAAHLKKPRRGFFAAGTLGGGRCCSNPPSRVKLEMPDKTKNQRIFYAGLFGGRGWISRAAHLKKPRRGFFARRTVRRADAVRIHPHS